MPNDLLATQSPAGSARYVGFAAPTAARWHRLATGRALRMDVQPGDRLNWRDEEGGATLCLLPFDEQRRPSPLLSPRHDAATIALDPSRFDSTALHAWLGHATGQVALALGGKHSLPGAVQTLETTQPGSVWFVLPAGSAASSDGAGGAVSIAVTPREPQDATSLPPPFGPVREEVRVPASSARAYRVRAGECIQIIDVQGQQCSDFMAVRADALARGVERCIDATVTRTLVGGAYPGPGLFDKFFDQDMRPILAVVQDTVGRHDTFALACTARGYEERGFPGHVNCSDNISAAYAPFGIAPRRAWPAINLFFNSWILPGDNRLRSDEAWSRPGDYVVMRALTDLICVTTACPDDIDPINAWNPTDIHVRIYPPEQPVPAALAYRFDAGAPVTMTEHSAFHPRTSALTRSYAPARDLWLPTSYEATRALEEYRACREAVTLQDLSSLRKFDVMGPDAERLLELCTTRDMRRLAVNRGCYALVCSESGAVIDDGTLWRLAPDVFRWCPSSEQSALHLRETAQERGLAVHVRSHERAMPNLALQGPRSRELLASVVFTQPTVPALESLKWFGFTIARLRDRDGPAFMLTRSGYTGELGYEIFCDRADALAIWDALMQAGAPLGLVPMGSEALGILRVEAGLAELGTEFRGDIDAYEAGLGFAVDLNSKSEFIGRAALQRIHAAPRRVLTGLVLQGNEVPSHGDGVFRGRERVGVVTSAVRSPALGCAIALARVAVEWAAPGHALEVGRLDGQMKRLPGTTAAYPFVDAQRKRARA